MMLPGLNTLVKSFVFSCCEQVQSKNLRAAPVRQLSVTKGRVEVKS